MSASSWKQSEDNEELETWEAERGQKVIVGQFSCVFGGLQKDQYGGESF